MKNRRRRETKPRTRPSSAADWYVRRDAERPEAGDGRRFAAWIAAERDHAAAYARAQASVFLIEKLRERGRLAWAFDEASAIARESKDEKTAARSMLDWARRPAFAWSITALSLAFAFATLLSASRSDVASPAGFAAQPGEPGTPPMVVDAVQNPVLVLPGGVFVDRRSVAVMPFSGANEPGASSAIDTSALAAQLYEEVVRSLESIPGMYVVASQAVEPYANGSIATVDVASQLGVRSIVEGRIETQENSVRVSINVVDVANDAQLVDERFESRISDMGTIDTDIASNIAAFLDPPGGDGVTENL